MSLTSWLFIKYKIYSDVFLYFSGITTGIIFIMVNSVYVENHKVKRLVAYIYPLIISMIYCAAIYIYASYIGVKANNGYDMALFSILLSIIVYLIISCTIILFNKFLNNKKTGIKIISSILILAFVICIWGSFVTVSYIGYSIDYEKDFTHLKLSEDVIAVCVEFEIRNHSFIKAEHITIEFKDKSKISQLILHNEWDNLLPWHTDANRFSTTNCKFYLPLKKYTAEEIKELLNGTAIVVKSQNRKIGEFTIQ